MTVAIKREGENIITLDWIDDGYSGSRELIFNQMIGKVNDE